MEMTRAKQTIFQFALNILLLVNRMKKNGSWAEREGCMRKRKEGWKCFNENYCTPFTNKPTDFKNLLGLKCRRFQIKKKKKR